MQKLTSFFLPHAGSSGGLDLLTLVVFCGQLVFVVLGVGIGACSGRDGGGGTRLLVAQHALYVCNQLSEMK